VATKRTTHRATSGKKLYAVRDKKGLIKEIKTYMRDTTGRETVVREEMVMLVNRAFIPVAIGADKFIMIATMEQAERGGHDHFVTWTEARQWLRAK
jgi:hypothetical protein